MDRRRILLGIGLLLVVGAVGFGLYVVFFRRPAAPPVAVPPVNLVPFVPPTLPPIIPIAPPAVPGLPGAPPAPEASPVARGGPTLATALTEQPASFVRLASDGRPQFYNPTDQRFYRIGTDGRAMALSDRQFPNVRSIAWSPRDDRAILEFPDGANILYDFRTNAQVSLPQHWESFSFAPDGARIAGKSIGLDPENRWLFESDADGNEFRAIEPLGRNAQRVDVSWSPNNTVVAFAHTGVSVGAEREQVLLIGRNGENFPGLVVEGQDFRATWSTDGATILYSAAHSSNDYKPEIWIAGGAGDGIGSNRRRLQVNTWADKCAFADATTVYCAVPERMERGYGLQPELADAIPDRIERIDLSTGTRSLVGQPTNNASVRALHIAPDGSTLYFVAQHDQRLYEMRLR